MEAALSEAQCANLGAKELWNKPFARVIARAGMQDNGWFGGLLLGRRRSVVCNEGTTGETDLACPGCGGLQRAEAWSPLA